LKSRPKIQQYRWIAGLCMLLTVCLVLRDNTARAQSGIPNNWRARRIIVAEGTVALDSLSISPGTFSIAGIHDTDYSLDPATATLRWKRRPAGDSVTVRYRVLPVSLSRRYYHKDLRRIDSQIAFSYVPAPGAAGAGSFVEFNGLEYTGSYGRSMSMGNNQDAALTSHFNLQAGGYLPDSIRLEAAISDNTMPFQPEGNTQRLQEFDQVYIRLSKHRHQLQAGDYNIEKPAGYFLNFNKRVQGLYYSSGFALGRSGDNSFGLSGSVAKGEFSRNIFNGLEGNQGPYKLSGNNGEQFFIVLAGTEKVYIDGLVQERGENADYIINYNTGEIRFMPRRLITKDSRIQVEFEYQSRNYLNSLVYAWDEMQLGKKWNIRLNVYSAQDAKNQGYQQALSSEQKRFLSAIGDSVGNAWFPVIGADTFSAGRILYKLVDTVVAGIRYDSVFIYSIDPDSARYVLSFSYIGPGRGDYVLSSKAANGRVYDWVPRADGRPQGDYAPVQLLITPKKQQVFTLAATYQVDSQKKLSIEVAAGNYDPNLFSRSGDGAHWGMATKVRYNGRRNFGKKDSLARTAWAWRNEAAYEYVQDRFRAIAPYRNVEFARDWNVPQPGSGRPDEHLLAYSTTLEHRTLGAGSYAFGYYGRGLSYAGYRNVLSYAIDKRRWRAEGVLNLLQAGDTVQRSRFFRPAALAEYRLGRLNHIAIGATFRQEDNRIVESYRDVLREGAYRFSIVSAYVRTPDTRPLHYGLTYTKRTDELPRANVLLQQSHSHTVDARIGIARSRNHVVAFTGAYRKLLVDDTGFNNQRPEETGLGRLEYTGSFLRGAIQLQTLYESGAGQEQKRTYTYVEVPAGQGIYTWVDYNGNGVQESNEFETALYPDQKKFIRIFTPTNEYVRVNYVTLNQSISIEPSACFGAAAGRGWRKLAGRFSDQGSLQITNRLTNTGAAEAMNPFIPALRDDRIIIAATSLSNTAFFNRNHTVWGIDYTWQRNSSKQLLSYGVEGMLNEQHAARLRWNINSSFSTSLHARMGTRGYESALSDGRTYAVQSRSGEPSLTWMHRGVLRLTGSLRYEERQNDPLYGGEQAVIRRADLECRYSKPVSGVLVLRGSYAGIAYDGLTTSPVAFTMLDALQPGANFLWYGAWDRRLGKSIELSVEYEGRRPGAGSVIHTGRMTVRAIL
jgi:hypothetical protein